MTTDPAEQSTEEFAAHSSVGMLIAAAEKAIKKNPAMPSGELFKYSLLPILKEIHKFHIDYTDSAAADEDSDVDVEAIVELAQDGKILILAQTALLMGAFAQLGYLDEKGEIIVDKMPTEVAPAYDNCKKMLADWSERYVDLIEEEAPDAPTETPTLHVVPPASAEGAAS